MREELKRAAKKLASEYATLTNPHVTVGIGHDKIIVFYHPTRNQTVYSTYEGFPVQYRGPFGPIRAFPAK